MNVASVAGLATWLITFDGVNFYQAYKDGVLIDTSTQNTGTARQPLAELLVGARGDGLGGKGYKVEGDLSGVKFWINGSTKETGDLVLDMPINDNSNTIVDYAPQIDGVLNAGTGQWISQSGRDYFDFNGDGNITFPRMWNPDAADPSFTVEFYNDISESSAKVIFTQTSNKFTEDEFTDELRDLINVDKTSVGYCRK